MRSYLCQDQDTHVSFLNGQVKEDSQFPKALYDWTSPPLWTTDTSVDLFEKERILQVSSSKPTEVPTTLKPTTSKPTKVPMTSKPTTLKPTEVPTTIEAHEGAHDMEANIEAYRGAHDTEAHDIEAHDI